MIQEEETDSDEESEAEDVDEILEGDPGEGVDTKQKVDKTEVVDNNAGTEPTDKNETEAANNGMGKE